MDMLAYIHWAPDPVIFDLAGREIRWYGLLFALGLLGGYFIFSYILKKENIKQSYADKLLFYVAIGAILGSRLGHVLFYEPDYYLSNPGEILKIWQGGLASHGAVIGIAIMVYLFARFSITKPFFWVGDRAVIAIALSAAFVRFGNLFNSEIYGHATTVPWAFIFELDDNIPRHPTQLYEAFSYIALSFILLQVYLKKRESLNTGMLTGLFFIGMFTLRFLIEFVKENQVAFEEGMALNMGQILSLPLIAIGILLVLLARTNKVPGF